MRQYHTGISLYRWFGTGCAVGCVLMNLLLDSGYPDAVWAAEILFQTAGFVGGIFRSFPLAAVGLMLLSAGGIAGLLRHTYRRPFRLSLIAMAAGGIYAGVAAILVRGMIIRQMSVR